MNEELIINKILDNARTEAENIIKNTNSEIEIMKQELVDYDKTLNEKSIAEIQKYRDETSQLDSENLEFSKNKYILETKNLVLEDLKKTAINNVKNLKKDEMLQFVDEILQRNAEKDETLLFNIDCITEKELNDLDIVKELNLKVEKNSSIDKGLFLTTEIYDKNLSFENLINDMFKKRQNQICEVLF